MGNLDWRNSGVAFGKILAQWGEEHERKAFAVESSRRPPKTDLRGRAKIHSCLHSCAAEFPGKAACIPAQPPSNLLHMRTLPLLLPLTWPQPLLWTMKCQPCISVLLPFHTIGFFQAFFSLPFCIFFEATYEIIDKRVQNHECCNKTKRYKKKKGKGKRIMLTMKP